MIMTLHQLLTNPSGKGSGHISARFRIIDDLKKKYLALHSKHKFRFAAYEDSGITLFHVQVPSESLDKPFFFDVLIEIDTLSKESKKALLESKVRVFSNNQAFSFTYAYKANKDDLIISWLKDKFDKKALTQKPVVRNPDVLMGFEKSIYYASQFILENRLFEKGRVKPVKLKVEELVDDIKDTSTIFQMYQKQKRFEASKRKKEKDRLRAENARKKLIEKKKKTSAKSAKSTKTVKKASTVKGVKKAKRAKRN